MALVMTTLVQATRPSVSYRILELGGSAGAVGVVTAAYAALAAVGAIPFGRVVDRIGTRPFLLGGVVVVGSTAIASALAPNVVVLGVAQALFGLGQISVVLSEQTLTANREDPGRGFARLTAANATGQTFGPLIAGFLINSGLGALFGVDPSVPVFFLSAAIAVVAMTLAHRISRFGDRSIDGRERKTIAPRSMLKIQRMPQAVLISVITVTAVDLLVTYLPVIGEARGVAPAVIGVLLSVRAIAGVISRLAVPRILRLLGKQRMLIGALGVSGVATLLLVPTESVWILGILIAVAGLGLGIGSPTTMAWIALLSPEGGRGTAMGVRMFGNRLGQVIMPLAAGALASWFGVGVIFLFVGTALTSGALWVHRSPLPD